jgi:hypothetical protein
VERSQANQADNGQRGGAAHHSGEYTGTGGRMIPIDLQIVRSIIRAVDERLPKFSATERQILELLTVHEELFGLQMVELSGGALKRGTVYVTLGRMQEKGYLDSRQEPLPPGAIGLPRRLYRPTGFALRALAAWKAAERAYLTGPTPQEAS